MSSETAFLLSSSIPPNCLNMVGAWKMSVVQPLKVAFQMEQSGIEEPFHLGTIAIHDVKT